MKKYTFKLNNDKKNNPSNNSNNFSAILDNIISDNILKANPYFKELHPDFGTLTSEKPTRQIDIDITYHKPSTKYTFNSNSYDSLFDAIEYIYNKRKDNRFNRFYDYKLADGTPIKIFGDEIQIGYDLIPMTKFTREYYHTLPQTTRDRIIDITIDIQRAA